MVVDNFWSTVGSDLQLVGEAVGTVALGAGTAITCTVGEAVTAGADTALCVAGVASHHRGGDRSRGKRDQPRFRRLTLPGAKRPDS